MDLTNFHTALVDFRTIYTFGFRVPNLNIRTYTDIHSLKSSFASSLSLSLSLSDFKDCKHTVIF
jgi:hypothetical protein